MRRTISHSQTFSVPLDLIERLTVVAGDLRISRSALVVQAIRREIERHDVDKRLLWKRRVTEDPVILAF